MKKYDLFNEAMKLRTLSRDMRLTLAASWAQILEAQGHQLQAAILYQQGKVFSKGAELFHARARWKLGRAAHAFQKDAGDSTVNEKYVIELENSSKSREAAVMAWEVMKDAEEAVRLMSFSSMWEDAFMVSSVSGRHDLVETEVRPAILSTAQLLKEELVKMDTRWQERSSRIMHLREQQQIKVQNCGDFEKVQTF